MKFFKAFVNLFKIKDLRKRFLIILFLLFIYRFFAHIPLPNVDLERYKELFSANQFLGLLNIFSGGILANASIALLGVSPYITASIIIQLLTYVIPKLKKLYHEEGEYGRFKIDQYTRYLTVLISFVQGMGFLNLLSLNNLVVFESFFEILRDAFILTVGSLIIMWIGEIITEQKLGNGISLIVFTGIISSLTRSLFLFFTTFSYEKLLIYIPFLILAFSLIALVTFINEAEKRIPLVSPKRVAGTRIYGGASTYLPLKITQAGVIPIIFALAFIAFPQTLAQFLYLFKLEFLNYFAEELVKILNNPFIFIFVYFFLVFGFTYFYTYTVFNPEEISKNLQRSGVFIPGIRPGKETEKYLADSINKINFFGGIFLGVIAILPYLTSYLTQTRYLAIGGTSLLILISVALETIKQIEAEISLRRYEI
ncbi:MAG: preprotein translocase subunit SecY [Candidatus Pacebacteria bacterium]|nr:preprotein translocase subunit SecY [Candidatus Paceibacterota bacterium]